MHSVRILGMVLLAVYLFFGGLFLLTGMSLPHLATGILGLIGMGAGVLLLISVGSDRKNN
ncbi:MAG TPA: hypothetical protein VIH61_09480 [Waddliaceae bacterium]